MSGATSVSGVLSRTREGHQDGSGTDKLDLSQNPTGQLALNVFSLMLGPSQLLDLMGTMSFLNPCDGIHELYNYFLPHKYTVTV